MIIISRSKKAKKQVKKVIANKGDRWDDEPTGIKRKEYKDPELCAVEGCTNFHMDTSNVCPDCYNIISNEMAKTVSSDQCLPLKMEDESTAKRFMKLVDGEDAKDE